MNKPLKDKQGKKHDPNEMSFYYEEDIKAAVEWFKELIRKEDLSLRVDIFTAIDQAFEDVTTDKGEKKQ